MKKFIVAAIAASMALPVYAADLGGRVLNIGSDTTYPPHEFIEDGVVKGFDVDVVAEICERINCTPNWVTTAWDGIFAALADGQFDIVWQTPGPIRADAWSPYIPESAKKIADWTYPWLCGNCSKPKHHARR